MRNIGYIESWNDSIFWLFCCVSHLSRDVSYFLEREEHAVLDRETGLAKKGRKTNQEKGRKQNPTHPSLSLSLSFTAPLISFSVRQQHCEGREKWEQRKAQAFVSLWSCNSCRGCFLLCSALQLCFGARNLIG